MQYFIVNQNKTYKKEHQERFLWAPQADKNGHKKHYWDSMQSIQKGDAIFCNKGGLIISIAIAKSSFINCENPFPTKDWEGMGYLIEVEYHDIEPVKYLDFIEQLLEYQPSKYGAFAKNGRVNEGYLFNLTNEQALSIIDHIGKSDIADEIHKDIFLCIDTDFKELEEEQRDCDQISQGLISTYSEEEMAKIEDKELEYNKEEWKNYTSSRIKTDPKLKATKLAKASYLCECDPSHQTFTNKTGEHPYMECHHFIPLQAKKDFPNLILDSMYNLTCLCPICHAQIHYGDKQARTEIIEKLYLIKKKELLKKGIRKADFDMIAHKYYKI